MALKKDKIIKSAVFFGVMIFIGEITLGNPDFPITLWKFEKISCWQWSVPVHAAGFIWMLFWNKIFINRNIILPILFSTLFFTAGETANWFVFNFFKYMENPFGAIGSFWIIILLYLGLCSMSCIIIRKDS